ARAAAAQRAVCSHAGPIEYVGGCERRCALRLAHRTLRPCGGGRPRAQEFTDEYDLARSARLTRHSVFESRKRAPLGVAENARPPLRQCVRRVELRDYTIARGGTGSRGGAGGKDNPP